MRKIEHQAEFLGKGEQPKQREKIYHTRVEPVKAKSVIWRMVRIWLTMVVALPYVVVMAGVAFIGVIALISTLGIIPAYFSSTPLTAEMLSSYWEIPITFLTCAAILVVMATFAAYVVKRAFSPEINIVVEKAKDFLEIW